MANGRSVRSLTFVFTDVEGSTRLWQDAPDSMSAALPRHDELIATTVEAAGGTLVKSGARGDSALAAFERATDALVCVVELQRAFRAEEWPADARLRIRSAIHTGEAEFRDDDYFGPTLNRAARLLSVAHGGQAVVSGATAEAIKDSTPPGIELEDLGEHVLKDLHRSERIFQVVAPGLEQTFPPLRSVDVVGQQLPTPLTSFVGRVDEVAAIGSLISDARIVTLTGVGGAGKTRLALQTAVEHAERFEDGVAFVDLAPVRDPTTVPRTLVGALDVMDPAAESPTDDAEAAAERLTAHLARTLKNRSMLLVTDNCEHVLDASSRLLTALLSACPKLRVLATSREPIGIAGEHVYAVPPLAEETESVRLFCDRAKAARSDFELSDANAASVADICRKLDGIPLAIELAAARTKSLSPQQIADRLGDALGLLAASGRGGIERHRTLEGALGWSHETFDEKERVLVRRLAVFNGGWSLDGAEAVCAETPLGRTEILDLLERLVDRSFVIVVEDDTGIRYRFLEPVRQFAEHKLVDAGEQTAMRDRHLGWFTQQVGDESFVLYSSEGRLSELMPEIDNYRAAMRWAIDSGDADSAMRIASGLNAVFVWMGHRTEADRWLSEALEIGDGAVTDLRASTIGTLAANQDVGGDMRRAVELQRQAADMFASLDNQPSLCWSLVYVGHGLHFKGELAEASETYARAVDIATAISDDVVSSLLRFLQAWMDLEEGNLTASRALCHEVIGSDGGHAGARLAAEGLLGACEFLEGDRQAGVATCDRIIATLLREFVDAAGNEDPMGVAFLFLVGRLEMADPALRERGRSQMADCLRRARRTGLLWTQPNGLEHAAALAAIEGRFADAARLLAGADALRSETGIELKSNHTQTFLDEGRSCAVEGLGRQGFDAEYGHGSGMSLPEILDLAQDVLEPA